MESLSPSVSNDNPFSESLFKTLKYVPSYPVRPFENLDDARNWVEKFVKWYNFEHLHSGIGFVTPNDRHEGMDKLKLEMRLQVYQEAKKRTPERWTKNIKSWSTSGTQSLIGWKN